MEATAALNRRHKLMPKALEATVPALHSTEDVATADKVVTAKLFSPYTGWRWYILEASREPDGDLLMFTWVTSPMCPDGEYGYTSLDELEALTGMGGTLPIVERDKWFETTPLADITSGQVT